MNVTNRYQIKPQRVMILSVVCAHLNSQISMALLPSNCLVNLLRHVYKILWVITSMLYSALCRLPGHIHSETMAMAFRQGLIELKVGSLIQSLDVLNDQKRVKIA